MRLSKPLLLAVPVLAFALAHTSDADACGGCFVPPEESTQVTGHRMMLSISKDETTLWDQIEYAGNPSSFAWVLPTKGVVEVGLSSDALFAFVEQMTQVNVYAPPLNCPPPPDCYYNDYGEGTSTATSGAGGGLAGGVTVVSQAVVGPYETVQLSSQDPAALKTWLLDHGYNLPPDISPIVDAYVSEGFNFLALKLVPGQGVEAMRPVRISASGANAALPLRMVAAGTGATTKITLWVVGEGRYDTQNFPDFTIQGSDIVWDWDTSSSNYADLKQAGFDATKGLGWLVEAGEPFAEYNLQGSLQQIVDVQPQLSGYGDANGAGAQPELDADLAKLFNTVSPASAWITRVHGELPRAALANDLVVGASMDQTQVTRTFQATKWKGTVPACPVYPPCNDTTGSGGSNGGTGAPGDFWTSFGSGNGKVTGTGGGCALGGSSEAPAFAAGLGLALAVALMRRRTSRRDR